MTRASASAEATLAGLARARLLAEIRALVGRFPAIRMHDLAVGSPTFEGTLLIDGEEHHVRLTLPPGYPAVPPEVRELERPAGKVLIPEGAMYRFADGSACLFTHGNDSQVWRKERMAVEALERFIVLIRRERERSAAPSRRLYRDPGRIFIPPGIAQVMLLQHGRGRLRLRGPASKRGDRYADAIVFEDDSLPGFEVELNQVWKAALPGEEWVPWLNLEFEGRTWTDVGRDRSSLDDELRRALPEAVYRSLAASETIVLARMAGGDTRLCDAVHFRRPADDLRSLYVREIDVASLQDRLFHRVDGVVNQRAVLGRTRVVLVGLGSLGGSVALALARAGVGRFVLIDPDILAVDNVCRHVCSLNFLGVPKVEAVKTMIQSINPEAEVHTIAKHLAWDLPWLGAGRELEGLLAQGGVGAIVATFAVGSNERQLNTLAIDAKVPVVYGSALGAAEHGRVFRVIPGETACYECILLAQERDPERFPRYAAVGLQGGEEAYLHPELPGLGIDLGQIAMLVARLTLQTLARTTGVDIGLPDEVGHHLLWSNRDGWEVCDRALQVAVRDVPRADDCPVCGRTGEDGELDPDDAKALEELLTELKRP